MKIVHVKKQDIYVFECPGCECAHWFDTKRWAWNEDFDSPTVAPSIFVREAPSQPRCHSYIKEGNIEFLQDSAHPLKGQTVPLPNIE